MSWKQISATMIQYEKTDGTPASNFYIAFEAAGTSTSINLATDSTGGTLLARTQLDSDGYTVTGALARFIPFIDQDYKISLYPTLADAQAKTNAEWSIDNIKPIGDTAVSSNIFFAENYDTFALAVAAAAGKELVISTNLVVASNITVADLTLSFIRGGNLDPNTGITITLNCPIIAGNYEIFDSTAAGTITGDILVDFVVPYWWGATGDGVADDTASFQAMADFGFTSIHFPPPPNFYSITDTIDFGKFVEDPGDGDITVSGTRDNWTFVGNTGSFTLTPKIVWTGANQPGTTIEVKSDSGGNYNLITDAKPMFSIVAGRNHSMSGITFDGGDLAYTAIHYQNNQAHQSHTNIRTTGVKIGIRNGQRWDYETGSVYWGYAAAPNYTAGATAIAAGGWQGDSHSYDVCSIGGSEASYSSESSQNLSLVFTGTIIRAPAGGAPFGMAFAGGRATLIGVGFIGVVTSDDIRALTGGCKVVAIDCHSESGSTTFFNTGTVTGTELNASNSDGVYIAIASGSGTFTVENCKDVTIVRTDADVRTDISINNSEIDLLSFGATTVKGNTNLIVSNSEYVGSGELLQGAGVTDLNLKIDNVKPVAILHNDAQSVQYLNNEKVSGRRWEKDSGDWGQRWNGGCIEVYGFKPSLVSGASTVLFEVTKFTGFSGTAFINLHYTNGSTAAKFSHSDTIMVTWNVDSGDAVTVQSTITVVGTNQILDGFSSMSTAYTVVDNAGNIDIGVTQTNNSGSASIVTFDAKFIQAFNSAQRELPYINVP